MKEESQIYHAPEQAFLRANWTYLQLGNNSTSGTSHPQSRFKHQSFYYKNRIYVHGGTTIPSNNLLDDPLDLFAYNLVDPETRKWEKIRTKTNYTKEMEVVSGHAGVVSGNKWFMFGGSNCDNHPNNMLWRLNLDNYEWVKLEQKGQTPSAREAAQLFFIQKNWLMLYGGISVTEIQIYNSFHFYNVDTKNWSLCEGTFMHQAHARLDPALVLHHQHLYLFGGNYRNSSNQEKYLNDFYDITFTPPARNLAAKVQIRRLISDVMPQNRSGHSLVALGQKHLFLLGGENSSLSFQEGTRTDDISLVEDAWVYDIVLNKWTKAQFDSVHFRFRTMGSCTLGQQDKLYVFGGLQQYSRVLGDLIELKINLADLVQNHQKLVQCPRCQQRQLLSCGPMYYSSDLIDDMVTNIDFAFAAFGLLIDNAVCSFASMVNIHFFQHWHYQEKILRIEDNANFPWTEEEFLTAISNFDAGPTLVPLGLDKKTKANLIKDNLRRQFGYNIKLGSLRLGQAFLYISVLSNSEIVRVCLFEKQKDGNIQRYVLSYYSYCKTSGEVSQPQMLAVKTKVQKKYGQLFNQPLSKKFIRNTLYILQPYVVDFYRAEAGNECQLKARTTHNDIINGSFQDMLILERAGYNIMDCVDVSLRAYITCLYLKNETTKIYLGVKSCDPVLVQTQLYLQKVDRLCKAKHVLEINQMLQFELKIVELYYLYDLKKKLGFFSNGLMIYHKNRLVTRYKYKLGELITRKMFKHQDHYNFIRLFGFVELPDHIPINIFKTNCTYQIMMQKLYSRFKFISKVLKKELNRMVTDPNLKRMTPMKLTDEEIQKDLLEQQGRDPVASKYNSDQGDQNIEEAKHHNSSDHSNHDKLVSLNNRMQLEQIYGVRIQNNYNIDYGLMNASGLVKNSNVSGQREEGIHLNDAVEDMQDQQDSDQSCSQELNAIEEEKKEDNLPQAFLQQQLQNRPSIQTVNHVQDHNQLQNKKQMWNYYDALPTIIKQNASSQKQGADRRQNKSDQLMAKHPNAQICNGRQSVSGLGILGNAHHISFEMLQEMQKERVLSDQQQRLLQYQKNLQQK